MRITRCYCPKETCEENVFRILAQERGLVSSGDGGGRLSFGGFSSGGVKQLLVHQNLHAESESANASVRITRCYGQHEPEQDI